MRIVFLYNESTEDPARIAEENDPRRSPIIASLRRLSHEVVPIACTLDLAAVRDKLHCTKPDVVLNRVESLGGSDAMMGAVPLLLETMRLPYTGCTGDALAATASKLAVKQRLARAGLPTPPWITADGNCSPCFQLRAPCQVIVKSVYEHASFQINDSAVIEPADPRQVVRRLQQREAETERPFFAERYIDGREFNLSIWGNESEVLPPAEIDFSEFPVGKPRIVAHGAKWDAASFEYHHTRRRFHFPAADEPLLRRLCELSRECAPLFNLHGGYSRIDFRCDADCQPWILEINTNPCLSPDAGFAAAVEQAGFSFDEAIQRLLADALSRSPRCSTLEPRCDSIDLVGVPTPNTAAQG